MSWADIEVWDDPTDSQQYKNQTFTICVLGFTTQPALWTPQNDGVTNLEKFAFNMNSAAPDVRRLTVGADETAGLPGATLAAGKLRIGFFRRKSSTNAGITYTPRFSSNIGTRDNFGGVPVSVSDVGVGTDWERVVVDDPTGGTARFGRLKVIKSP